MKIQAINNQTFGTKKSYEICKKYPETFYTLSEDDKLDVVYDMLKEQKKDLITLSKNQYNIQQCNDNASMMILDSLKNYCDAAKLGTCFDNKRIDLIS